LATILVFKKNDFAKFRKSVALIGRRQEDIQVFIFGRVGVLQGDRIGRIFASWTIVTAGQSFLKLQK
jgi:hypothetical protein